MCVRGQCIACMHVQRPEEDIGYLSLSLSCLDTEFLTKPNAPPFFFQLCKIAVKLWASACSLPVLALETRMAMIFSYIKIDGGDLISNPYAQAVILFIYWAISPIHLDIILLDVFNLLIFNYNSLHDATYRALHYGCHFGIRKFYIRGHLRFQILAYGCSFKV